MKSLKKYSSFMEAPIFTGAGADSAISPSEIKDALEAIKKWNNISDSEKSNMLPKITKVVTELSQKDKKVYVPKEYANAVAFTVKFYGDKVVPFIKKSPSEKNTSNTSEKTTNLVPAEQELKPNDQYHHGDMVDKNTGELVKASNLKSTKDNEKWIYNPRQGVYVSSITGQSRAQNPNDDISKKANEKITQYKSKANDAIRSAISQQKKSAA